MKLYVLHILDSELEDIVHCSLHHSLQGAKDEADTVAARDEDDDYFGEFKPLPTPTEAWTAQNSYMDAVIELLEVQP